jgi:hypothetical protein
VKIAAWGNRTQDGKLFSGRNLDWNANTGINKFKLVTVFHPPNKYVAVCVLHTHPENEESCVGPRVGGFFCSHGHVAALHRTVHATFGFVGVWGALAGMVGAPQPNAPVSVWPFSHMRGFIVGGRSHGARGQPGGGCACPRRLTCCSHRALTLFDRSSSRQENEITFNGFPWLLRLRYIMENAANTQQAYALWSATNNTVGFNHMVASAADAAAFAAGSYTGPGVALVMETMYEYTAYFTDNDPR